jgi:hypothetical protein
LLINAEVNGQLQHQQLHGEFPVDQKGFVEAYLVNKGEALSKVW